MGTSFLPRSLEIEEHMHGPAMYSTPPAKAKILGYTTPSVEPIRARHKWPFNDPQRYNGTEVLELSLYPSCKVLINIFSRLFVRDTTELCMVQKTSFEHI
jgi:hypothetical protein